MRNALARSAANYLNSTSCDSKLLTMLRKVCLTILSLFVFAVAGLAKKIEGDIIREKDTLHVVFTIPFKLLASHPNFEKLQYKIKYADGTGALRVLRPADAIEIRFKYNNQEIRMLSRRNTLGGGSLFSNKNHIFLHLLKDGTLKLFNFYYTQSNPGMYGASGAMVGATAYSVERYVLEKKGGDLMQPKAISFRKEMSEYFSDCPVLAMRIENKELKRDDLLAIIAYYNSTCE